jgi:hypothetical protein
MRELNSSMSTFIVFSIASSSIARSLFQHHPIKGFQTAKHIKVIHQVCVNRSCFGRSVNPFHENNAEYKAEKNAEMSSVLFVLSGGQLFNPYSPQGKGQMWASHQTYTFENKQKHT